MNWHCFTNVFEGPLHSHTNNNKTSVFTITIGVAQSIFDYTRQHEADVSMDKGAVRTVTDLAARQKKEDHSGDSGPTFDVFYFKAHANKEVNTNKYCQRVLVAKVRSKQNTFNQDLF